MTNGTTLLDNELRDRAFLFGGRVEGLKEHFVERDLVIDLLAVAVLAREHVLLIGPPGTAKTSVLDRFSTMLQARSFRCLLTRFTEPAELFGALDIEEFRKGTYRINPEGMLPTAEIAFIDEVFNGSSAILNALLTLVQERRYNNGAQVTTASLMTLLGASNSIPDDDLLRGFADRFLLRASLGPVPDDSVGDLLRVGWSTERDRSLNGADPPETFALRDLERLQRALFDVRLTSVRALYESIMRDIRNEGIRYSDRRAVVAQKAVAAAAILAGRSEAQPADLWPLAHTWDDPRDEASLRRVVESYDVDPRGARGRGPRPVEEVMLDARMLEGRLAHVASADEGREVVRQLGLLATELRRDHPANIDARQRVQEAVSAAVHIVSERFGKGVFDV